MTKPSQANDFIYTIDLASSTVFLSGVINDNFSIELSELEGLSCIHFDFEDIRIINSSGILKLIRFLQALPPHQTVKYFNVPAAVINQMSLVNGIISSRFTVVTFYVPYTPKDSDDQIMIRLSTEEVRSTGKLPPKKHPSTNALLLPDVNETKFLNFLKF